jgi:Ricin-type beta-trefoil lectin domain/Cellulase (glycosyl hydrolase family 5)
MNATARHRARAALAICILISGLLTALISAPARAALAASQVRGVNWGDPRDNFVCGNLLPSGLYAGESYSVIFSKAGAITSRLSSLTGANTIRLPVNVDTVTGSFWTSYYGAIDAAIAQGLSVILSEWDQCNSRDGMLDPNWQGLWDRVVSRYGSNDLVFFEIMNEPFGYSTSAWLNAAAGWIARYPSVPRGRIIVSGPGYNDNAFAVGRDSRFAGTLLSIHHYAFWQDPQSYNNWRTQTRSKVAEFASRTIFTEIGTFMTTGLNFNNTAATTNEILYMRGITDEFNALGVGSVYWPGLRAGDPYALTTITGAAQNGSGSSISLNLNSSSGLDRIRNGWRLSTGTPATPVATSIRGEQSGRCLDIPDGANGTGLIIWDCNATAAHQKFIYTAAGQLQVRSKCLDVAEESRTPGARVVLWDCTGRENQRWTLSSDGTIVGTQSGLCLDVVGQATANHSTIDVWTCNGGANQRWSRN